MNTVKRFFLFIFIIGFALKLQAQSDLLQSGPMLGYSTMKEALLWVQTKQAASVYFKYWNTKSPKVMNQTKTVFTSSDNAFVAHILADKLEPSQKYEYELYINRKKINLSYPLHFESQTLWKWRGDAPDFSFATGSCAYINESQYDRPGTPYGSNYQIFNQIYNAKPNFMLWLGDNLYLREADWNSTTGIQHRYTHAHSLPELQPVWGSMHHYFIWDDHDYGTDNSDRSFWMKKTTNKIFKTFYPNPNYIFEEGITGFFDWADCDFFLLDNRYWRSPDNRTDLENPTILGEAQLQWLIDALSYSKASFKFVAMGGQFLNPLKKGETYSNIAPKEKQYIIDKIQELKIEGVIFLTGDVHHTELSKLDLPNAYPLYDLTVSPFTSGVAGRGAEDNPLQVNGTLIKEHNFAKIEVFGTLKERTLRINILNSNGELKWSNEIKAADLKF